MIGPYWLTHDTFIANPTLDHALILVSIKSLFEKVPLVFLFSIFFFPQYLTAYTLDL